MKHSIGFIGGGRVTKILLQGFKNKNVKFEKVVVADTNTENLKRRFPDIVSADAKSAASQDIVFIALHPPMIMDTLELIKNDVKAEAAVISLAPKINFPKLALKLGHVKNLARLIPNATSYINEGFNPVTFAPGFDQEKRGEMLMSAMLPTYFWFQWRELAGIGVKTGLTEEESKQSIFQTIVASLDLLYKSGLTPQEVIDLIPVKPIGEHEPQITEIYNTKLLGLFEKIKPS
ncbi:MAG: NAD(P)-binding domain-containing protein [Bacteroidales bacterium]|nr:NAD(P)-binding domain-containing protein [Bacteroidales bacterium]